MKNYVKLLLIVDGSNLAHRSYEKFKTLKSANKKSSGLIYGFLRLLQGYVIRFQPTYLIVTFDTKQSKASNFRNNIILSYKGHRDKLNLNFDYEDFNRQSRVVKRALKYMNVPVLWDKEGLGHEADDYIAYFAKVHPGKVVIISSDKDFGQIIDNRIKIFNPSKEVIVRPDNCKDLYGYDVKECVDYLCLVGDKSDDIPGYRGIGPVKARKFLDKFGSISNFLLDTSAEFPGIDRDGLKFLYDRNVEMIDLNLAITKYPFKKIPLLYYKNNEVNSSKLHKLFEEYTMRSFQTKEFIEPFKKLRVWKVK